MRIKQYFTSRQRLWIYLFSGVVLILLYNVLVLLFQAQNTEDHIVGNFQHRFLENQRELDSQAEQVLSILQQNKINLWPELEKATKAGNIIAQIYRDDELYFWNSQLVDNEILRLPDPNADTVVQLNTGWYLLNKSDDGIFSIFLLKLIKSEYPYINSYLL